MSGFKSCILRMLLTWRYVMGKSNVRTTMVSMTMASHHGAPQPWKVESVAPIRLNSGSRRFLKKSSMFRRFLFRGLEVSGARSRTLAGTRPLHPAAEAGEENDERAEQECQEDGKVARLASDTIPYDRRPQNPCGDAAGRGQGARALGDADRELADAAGRAEQRQQRKAVLEVGVDLFPGEEVDEQAEQYEPECEGGDPPQRSRYDHRAPFLQLSAQTRSPTKILAATLLLARALSLALFRPPTIGACLPL